MARIDWIEDRLLNWQRWRLTQGSGCMGYARIDLTNLTPEVREAWAEAAIPTNDIEASVTEDAVQRLPSELKATVMVKYLGKLDPRNVRERCAVCERDQLMKLAIGRPTLYARIERAQRLLADHFNAQRDRRDRERDRVARAAKSHRKVVWE